MNQTANLFKQLNKYALDNNNIQQFMMHQYFKEKTKIYNKNQSKKEDKSKNNEDFFIPDEIAQTISTNYPFLADHLTTALTCGPTSQQRPRQPERGHQACRYHIRSCSRRRTDCLC